MATYLLTWKSTNWAWEGLDDEIDHIRKKGSSEIRWSCGNTKRIKVGDRAFLISLGNEKQHGIMGAGTVVSESYEDIHWDEEKAKRNIPANYVEVQFTTLLNPERDAILPKAAIEGLRPSTMNWSPRASGVQIPDEIALALETIWADFTGNPEANYPEELPTSETYSEGHTKTISVNKYERNPKSRQSCIDYHGTDCSACGMNFYETYGVVGKGFIQVHHLTPLAQIRSEYKIDPINDLAPLCPNCHAMTHRRNPPYSIDEIRNFLNKKRS